MMHPTSSNAGSNFTECWIQLHRMGDTTSSIYSPDVGNHSAEDHFFGTGLHRSRRRTHCSVAVRRSRGPANPLNVLVGPEDRNRPTRLDWRATLPRRARRQSASRHAHPDDCVRPGCPDAQMSWCQEIGDGDPAHHIVQGALLALGGVIRAQGRLQGHDATREIEVSVAAAGTRLSASEPTPR